MFWLNAIMFLVVALNLPEKATLSQFAAIVVPVMIYGFVANYIGKDDYDDFGY